MVAVGGHDKALRFDGAQVVKTHQARDALFTARYARSAEFLIDAGTAIGLRTFLIGCLDLLGQCLIFLLAYTLAAFLPGVEATSTDLHRRAERGEGELLLVFFDELVSHWGRTRKIPTAFF